MIKYKVTFDHKSDKHTITKTEVDSETRYKVVIDGKQILKRTQYEDNYFNTFKEAKEYILAEIQNKIEHVSALIFEHKKAVSSYIKKSATFEELSEGDI